MLDVLLPPTCVGCRRLIRTRADPWLCSACRLDHVELPPSHRRQAGVEALFAYEGPLARAVARLKFSGDVALAGPLGRLLATAPTFFDPWDLLVPVPLHWRRALARGFNQSQLLARWALEHAPTRARLTTRLLARTRPTRPQSELPAAQRNGNVRGAFRIGNARRARGMRVLVIDDVTTTGATMRACMDTLARAGARQVGGLALLRTLA